MKNAAATAACSRVAGLSLLVWLVGLPDLARADHVVGMTEMAPSHGHAMSPAVAVTGGMVTAPWKVTLMFGHVTAHANVTYKRSGRGFDDVQLGDRLLVGAAAAMHVTGGLALSAEVLLRVDGDDDYPNADVDSPATAASDNPMAPQLQRAVLRGSTQGDPILYVTPGVSYTFGKRARISGGLLIPAITGDEGVIPNPSFLVRVVVNTE